MSRKYELVPVAPTTMQPVAKEKKNTVLTIPLAQTEAQPQNQFFDHPTVNEPVATIGDFLDTIPKEFKKSASIILSRLQTAPITLGGTDFIVTYKTPPEMEGSSLHTLMIWSLDPKWNQSRPFDGLKWLQLLQRQQVPMQLLDPEKVKLLSLTPEGAEAKKKKKQNVISPLPIITNGKKRKLPWHQIF